MGNWPAASLLLGGALYDTRIGNEVIVDPTDNTAYLQSGEKRVRGIELSAIGRVTDAWSLSAGYTLMDADVAQGPAVSADGSANLAYAPRSAFTGWTSYDFGNGFSIGGGARYNGRMRRGSDSAIGTPAYIEAYWVADAMASYAFSEAFDLRLNLYNLFDREYVAAINKRAATATSRHAAHGAADRQLPFLTGGDGHAAAHPRNPRPGAGGADAAAARGRAMDRRPRDRRRAGRAGQAQPVVARRIALARGTRRRSAGGPGREPLYHAAVLPAKTLPPRFNRYEGGGEYGMHVDGAAMALGNGEWLRSDVSCTLFLADRTATTAANWSSATPMASTR